MLVGGIIPIGTYAAPMFASLLLIFLLREMPVQMCVGWYFVVSILSGLLCPEFTFKTYRPAQQAGY